MKHGKLPTIGIVAMIVAMISTATAFAVAAQMDGGPINQVRVIHNDADIQTTNINWQNIPGSQTTLTIPPGEQGLILARFSGSSSCTSSNIPRGCHVRVLIGGVNAAPQDPVVFDTSLPGEDDGWESHSFDAARGPLPPGNYIVRPQWRVEPTPGGSAGTIFRLDEYSVTYEVSRVG